MLKASKTNSMMRNFCYDGDMKPYLVKLPFHEARMIFLLRSRMFPSKCNFPGRWSQSKLCTFCCDIETDEHLFNCCGYMDLHKYEVKHEWFLSLDGDMQKLSSGAKILIKIYERLLQINEDVDVTK